MAPAEPHEQHCPDELRRRRRFHRRPASSPQSWSGVPQPRGLAAMSIASPHRSWHRPRQRCMTEHLPEGSPSGTEGQSIWRDGRKAGPQVPSEPVGSYMTALIKPPPNCPVEYDRPLWPSDLLYRAGLARTTPDLRGLHAQLVARHFVLASAETQRRRHCPSLFQRS